jgi:uncharacterized membrane protein
MKPRFIKDQSLKSYIPLVVLVSIFCTIYCLISIVNHNNLRTYALDLGMFNHAIYSFAHFRANYFTLAYEGTEMNYFGDHFSPITILYAPFYYLFKSYTLLIIQIIAILFGGIGIYRYASAHFSGNKIPLLILLHFFGIWGIYSALAFDFHNNVIAAMFVPWMVYYYEKNDRKWFLLFFFLILIAKENMSLWLAFILIGLMWKHHKKGFKSFLKFEIPLVLFSLLYFFIIISIVMPAIRHYEGQDQLSKYVSLGSSVPEILLSAIKDPRNIFTLLFESPVSDPILYGIKSELHFMVLVSGGFAFLYRPYYLVMLLPIYAQKLLTDNYGLWGINNQYSIEFAPLLSLGLIDLLSKKKPALIYWTLLVTTLLTFYFNYATLEDRRSSWYERVNYIFHKKEHYDPQLNVKEIHKALEIIPENATLSVSSCLAPRLAFREKIYNFPIVKEAEYIALVTNFRTTYPISREEFDQKVMEYKNSGKYQVVYENYDLLIMRKVN